MLEALSTFDDDDDDADIQGLSHARILTTPC